eukprot:402377-Alexandrium_andersonii.AAC.1
MRALGAPTNRAFRDVESFWCWRVPFSDARASHQPVSCAGERAIGPAYIIVDDALVALGLVMSPH